MTTQYDQGKNSATLAMLLNAFERQPGSRKIDDNSPSDFLSGDTALEMLYPMRGGAPIDYNTGIDIMDELYLFFYYENTARLDGRPCQGDVSVGANVKFQFEMEKIIMIPVQFDISNSTSTGVRANGSTWPSQELSAAAVEGLLDQAYPVTQPKPGDPTPATQQFYSAGLAGALFYWDLTTSKVGGALQATWPEYQLILDAVREYYADHDVTPMVLTVYIQTDNKWNACAKIVIHKDPRGDIPVTSPGAEGTTQNTLSSHSNNTISPPDGFSVDVA